MPPADISEPCWTKHHVSKHHVSHLQVVHNIALAEYCASPSPEALQRLTSQLKFCEVRLQRPQQLQQHASPSSGYVWDGHARLDPFQLTSFPRMLQVSTTQDSPSPSAATASTTEFPGVPAATAAASSSSCIAPRVNLALLLTLQQQHASALALLEPLYACLDTSYAGVSLRVCCLLLDNYLASQQYSKAAQVICYLEATAAALASAAASSSTTDLQPLQQQDQQEQQQGERSDSSLGIITKAKQEGSTSAKHMAGRDARAVSCSGSANCDAIAVPQLSHYLGPYMEQVRLCSNEQASKRRLWDGF
jgi:hypothetical protein